MGQLSTQFALLAEFSKFGRRRETVHIEQSLMSGVKVSSNGSPSAADRVTLSKAGNFRCSAPCGSPFCKGLDEQWQLMGHGPVCDEKAAVAMSFQEGERDCTLRLRQADEDLYTLTAQFEDGDPRDRAGRYLAVMLESALKAWQETPSPVITDPAPVSSTTGPTGTPFEPVSTNSNGPEKSSRGYAAWAVLSPGMPWLVDNTDSWDAFGISASALDVAVLVGSALAYNRSSNLRNQYWEGQPDPELLASSQEFRNLGHGLLISAAAMRVAAGLGYLIWRPTLKDRTHPRSGSYSLIWTF